MAANAAQPDRFQWDGIQADGNARQHNGNAYNNTINNYAANTPHGNVPVKPPKDPIHGDLMRACGQGQGPQRLNLLLARGADIDYRDEKQRTPLHQAASSGSLSTVSHLVNIGADIHASASRIGTPLHSAALSGSAEAVRYLVEAGAKVDETDEWIGTPLHCAAFCGSAKTVRCLLESGADLDTFSTWVGVALSIAAAKAHIDVVEVLLENGADVNMDCGYFGSVAHMACASGDMEVLQKLQRAGARFDLEKVVSRAVYGDMLHAMDSPFSDLLGSRYLSGREVVSGRPVILAITHGKLEAVMFCMDMNPLGPIYSTYGQRCYTNEASRSPRIHLRSFIDVAIEALDLDMLQLLLDRGLVPGRGTIISWIHILGGNPHVIPPKGRSRSACLSLLIRHGLQTNSLDTEGNVGGDTPLMAIMRRSMDDANYEIAEALLQHGAQVNAVNSDGQTALMIVAGTSNKSRLQCVQLLCAHGATVDLKDRDGHTALRYAEKWGGVEGSEDVKRILQWLSQNGPKQAVGFSSIVKSWMSK